MFEPPMFEPTSKPRIFATPIGVDFCAALIDGLNSAMKGKPPEALARVEILVANARMQRRLQALFLNGQPGLMPRIRHIQSLADTLILGEIPPARSPLELRLELAQLISKLMETAPGIAPKGALYDLADSLADFLGEMDEEGVKPETIANLDMGAHSEHWSKAQAFLNIAARVVASDERSTKEARQARLVSALEEQWQAAPPRHPILLAGSTGSRRTTFRLMQAVARLPQGAVILPGIDREMPRHLWSSLLDGRRTGLSGEDHPQYRLARVIDEAGISIEDVPDWGRLTPSNPPRNRLVSLALRPAPVTDQWREEGPKLEDLGIALGEITLLEAPSPQVEATAIALGLRDAIESGRSGALVTPDKQLSRRVSAQLDRWGIMPDDSAGVPLGQTAPGRLLRQIADADTRDISAEALVALLKHPLCHTGSDRRWHLLRSRDLELQVLRRSAAFPSAETLMTWASERADDDGAVTWMGWIIDLFLGPADHGNMPLSKRVERLASRARKLAAGPASEGSGALFEKEAGIEAEKLLSELQGVASAGGEMNARNFADFFSALCSDREVRSALRPHADVLIWGTQEARVQGADLVIMAGLNEGIWPAATKADPWLNRPLRAEAGLRLPDRIVGLSAHDFQQGIAGKQVWLSRSRRDDETETVPARWLNRLVNLLSGASESSADHLKAIRKSGEDWIEMARRLNTPDHATPPAPRPAPAPQLSPRLTSLSVTEIEKLIRDPYAIYAKHLLGLRPLDPLRNVPDARLRGTVIHEIMEKFLRATPGDLPPDASELFREIAREVIAEHTPWASTRQLWEARVSRILPWIMGVETALRQQGEPWIVEKKHVWEIPGLGLKLIAKADRIDKLSAGGAAIFDYKTGAVPTERQARHFNKQLWLEALMAEAGAFGGERVEVKRLAYIGLGSTPDLRDEPVTRAGLAEIDAGLRRLILAYQDESAGFPSRNSLEKTRFDGDYDHLARFGEWDDTHTPVLLTVGARHGK